MIDKVINDIKEKARVEYVEYLNISSSIECLGTDFKINDGSFDKRNLYAYQKAAEHYGKHSAYIEMIDVLNELKINMATRSNL